ncbi:hypothetical protein X962_5661 [Burkholderia pseudomallei MSHR7343]|nr:hypothetical protein X962_5661 [Burkholderia pseudomallei MSHR7343]
MRGPVSPARRSRRRPPRGDCFGRHRARAGVRSAGDVAQHGVGDHRPMPRAQPRRRRIAAERRAERIAVRDAMKAERADEQMQIERIDVVAEHAAFDAAREQFLERLDDADVAVLERLQLLDVFRAVNVLDRHEAHEIAMPVVIVEREFDEPAQPFARLQLADVQFALERADVAVDLLQHCLVQPFLAVEVVIEHPLRRVRAFGDRVDARPRQSHRGEFLRGDVENIALRLLGVVFAARLVSPRFGVGRCGLASLFHFGVIGRRHGRRILARAPGGFCPTPGSKGADERAGRRVRSGARRARRAPRTRCT